MCADTDSVMIQCLFTKDINEAAKVSIELAAWITKYHVSGLTLAFEKIFGRFLLIEKKRYAHCRRAVMDDY